MINAVIFDMDGVISDTQSLHLEIESKILKRYGIHINKEKVEDKYAGYRCGDFLRAIGKEHNVDLDVAAIEQEKWKEIIKSSRQYVLPMPGMIEFANDCYRSGLKMAVATSSIYEFAEIVLEQLKIKDCFREIVTGEMVQNGKPAPDIFMKAAETLEVPYGECVVIEDGRSGMEGAKRAGMKCIGLVDNDGEYPTDILVESFDEIDVNFIKSL